MDIIYPYSTPQILTEAVYATYNGWSGSASPEQLEAAFVMSEENATAELGSYLLPTTTTGTATLPILDQVLVLPYGHVSSVAAVRVVAHQYGQCEDVFTAGVSCAYILDEYAGIISLRGLGSICPCAYQGPPPYRVELVFTSGLPAGKAVSTPNILHALTIAAQLALEQIIDPAAAEGGPGDPGVQAWRSLGYQEQRTPLRDTAFGSSPRANYAARLLGRYKVRRVGKAGW